LTDEQQQQPNDILTDYLQSLYGVDILPTEEEHRLAYRIAEGDQKALDKLIKHNLRFVVYIVRKMTAWKYSRMPLEDLLAMGNEQLTIAARRWTPTNNARFATYARSFIEKGVRRELDNTANLIRLPVNIMEAVKKMNYNERALSQVLGRKPKISEVATMMGVDEERVRLLQSYLTREPVSLEHLNEERFLEEQDD
jgi:RNA polymerase primary sigma factor